VVAAASASAALSRRGNELSVRVSPRRGRPVAGSRQPAAVRRLFVRLWGLGASDVTSPFPFPCAVGMTVSALIPHVAPTGRRPSPAARLLGHVRPFLGWSTLFLRPPSPTHCAEPIPVCLFFSVSWTREAEHGERQLLAACAILEVHVSCWVPWIDFAALCLSDVVDSGGGGGDHGRALTGGWRVGLGADQLLGGFRALLQRGSSAEPARRPAGCEEEL
jgi:hypothetical protein